MRFIFFLNKGCGKRIVLKELASSNGIVQFLLIVLITLFASAKVTLQGRACRKYVRNTQDSVLYNILFFASVAVALCVLFPMAAPDKSTVLLAAAASIANVAYQVLYSVSLTIGPVSLTVLIVNFSVLIPTAMSFLAFGEKMYYTQLLGIAFLIISMLLSVNKTEGERKASKKWLIFTIIALICTGTTSSVQKLFYKTEASTVANSDITLLVFIYVFSTLLALAVYIFNFCTGKKEKSTFWFSKNVLFYAIGVGVIIAVFQKLYMFCSENIDGSFMFPTYTGLQSVSMSVIGIVLFKDRLTLRQKLGVLCGVISVAAMNLKIGGFFTI